MYGFDVLPLWAVFLIELAAGWIVLEAGYRSGRWRHARSAEEKDAPVGAMVAAILGLVAFMLAFTLVWLRQGSTPNAKLCLKRPTPSARRISARVSAGAAEERRGQAAARLRRRARAPCRRETSAKRSPNPKSCQESMWQQAVAAADKDHGSIMTGLFVQSLNEMIDVHAKRLLAGVRGRIPLTIWFGLFSLAGLGIGAMGYQAGLSATRRSPAMMALVVAFAGVLFLIVDLDRGREGLLTVDQTAMTDLQRSMHASETP